MDKKKKQGICARNVFLAVYVSVLLTASVWLCVATFGTQRTVLIDDRDVVMQRRTSVVPVSAEIRAPRWGSSELEDRNKIFELSQLMGRISLYYIGSSQVPESEALEGKITYIDGTSIAFVLESTLCYEGNAYGGSSMVFELESLRRMLTQEMYTLNNLAGFFYPQHHIAITRNGISQTLGGDAVELLRSALLTCREVPNPIDIEYHIRNRETPSGIITVKRFGNISDTIMLALYDSDTIEVYDVSGGNGMVMVLTGDVDAIYHKL